MGTKKRVVSRGEYPRIQQVAHMIKLVSDQNPTRSEMETLNLFLPWLLRSMGQDRLPSLSQFQHALRLYGLPEEGIFGYSSTMADIVIQPQEGLWEPRLPEMPFDLTRLSARSQDFVSKVMASQPERDGSGGAVLRECVLVEFADFKDITESLREVGLPLFPRHFFELLKYREEHDDLSPVNALVGFDDESHLVSAFHDQRGWNPQIEGPEYFKHALNPGLLMYFRTHPFTP